ncbi:unnamed protein product [Haemonchus placei]|uniref:Secreted protein n=1 Tax=Haemonchus placei TaxID=6290 RepID=A0A0N4X3Q3_HAEPC|nr:unnamed protein product [Haemonchus placei]
MIMVLTVLVSLGKIRSSTVPSEPDDAARNTPSVMVPVYVCSLSVGAKCRAMSKFRLLTPM